MKRKSFFKKSARGCLFFGLALIFSCATAEERLAPPKSTSEYRLGDIEKNIAEAPEKALHLAGVYRAIYGSGFDEETENHVKRLEAAAVEKLRENQALAIREKRWDDAASMARSLAALGITVENTGMEPDIILAGAKDALNEGSNLQAFLAVVRANELEPLTVSDILPFLERAVRQKQRRTAAFLLEAAEAALRAGRFGGAENQAAALPEEFREYATGRDTVTDMVKGVATVFVDRGYRTERGRAFPDRVLGSAFFVDSSGLLVTNYHVIASEVDPKYEGYSRMYLRMGDASSVRIPAKVLGWDKAMDLAIIKADITPEYVFPVVDRVTPKAGDTVYAIGSPGGLEKTVTQGIVSARGRRFLQIGDVIQIDAAVNPGNSGGPVVDIDGRLVGIVFAGADRYQGLNFAVPVERLAAALPAMLKGGKAERPWLGLVLSETGGESPRAEILYVAPFTPAWEQKVGEASLIEKINGEEITAAQGSLIPALQDVLFPVRPGELVALETSDEFGARQTRIVMTAVRPEVPLAEAAEKDSRERMAAPLFGLVLSPAGTTGFSTSYRVKKVVRGSVADEAGLSEQDPVSIRGFRVEKNAGIALLDISVKEKRMAYMETTMRLPAMLDSPDTL
ncbi:MAG: trypsin-like peptidase domain-containing protein [Treponema sp.]|jgi:S1-C subfamily serine protease|nr:trypsin-like peptidase domain-containing protein [Treponema sp.]